MDLRIDLDVHVALQGHLGVAVFDLRLDPAGEGVAEDSICYVRDPLLGELAHLLFLRVEEMDLCMAVDELRQLVQRERLVLGHLQVAALVVFDV